MLYTKTAEEHKNFLVSMIKLKLWFVAKWKYENPNETIQSIVNERTLLRNYSKFNPGVLNQDLKNVEMSAAWGNLVDEIESIYISQKVKSDYELFENTAYALFEGVIDDRIERDLDLFNNQYVSDESRNGSCFFFEANVEDNSEEGIYLQKNYGDGKKFMRAHQWNNRYPESYLADKKFFRRSLIKLIDDVESLGCAGIYGTGWMNLFPLFSKMFPPEWRKNAIGPSYDIKGNLGCWGQFITPNYSFQHKIGERYRREHFIPFPTTLSFSTNEDFRRFFSKSPV